MNGSETLGQNFSGLDYAPVGMCVINKDYLVLYWNRCLEGWSGITAAGIVGSDLRVRFTHLKHPKYQSRLDTIFQGGAAGRFLIPAPPTYHSLSAAGRQ